MAVTAGVLWTGVVPVSMSSPPALVLSLELNPFSFLVKDCVDWSLIDLAHSWGSGGSVDLTLFLWNFSAGSCRASRL